MKGRGGKSKLVIVAAREQAIGAEYVIGAGGDGRRPRQGIVVQLGGNARLFENVADVGQQAVGNIDGAARDAAQPAAQVDARLRRMQAGETGFKLRSLKPHAAGEMGEAEGRVAAGPGYPDIITGLRPVAALGQAGRQLPHDGNADAQRAARGVAANEFDAKAPGHGKKTARKGRDPGLVGGR